MAARSPILTRRDLTPSLIICPTFRFGPKSLSSFLATRLGRGLYLATVQGFLFISTWAAATRIALPPGLGMAKISLARAGQFASLTSAGVDGFTLPASSLRQVR